MNFRSNRVIFGRDTSAPLIKLQHYFQRKRDWWQVGVARVDRSTGTTAVKFAISRNPLTSSQSLSLTGFRVHYFMI